MKRHRDLLEVLRANGMRITKGRRALLQFLLDNHSRRVSLGEIHAHLDDDETRADRSSVYRNLIEFERLGIIQSIKVPRRGKTYRYVLDREIQPFYICKACGNARRGNPRLFARIDRALRGTRGFAKANLSIVFYGMCPACRGQASRLAMASPAPR